MKMVVIGNTYLPREELCGRLATAGLEVMNSVSRLTAVLVWNHLRHRPPGVEC